MNIWVSSDHHFNHENIIKFCHRPFHSVEEMNGVMIDRWNSVVDVNDTIYYLGDFTLSNAEYAQSVLGRLNGTIYALPGSHDKWIKNYPLVMPALVSLKLQNRNGDKPITVVLCHYSMRTWEKSHYGSYHLYGHSHGTLPGLGRSIDIGVDTNNFYPYNLDEVINKLSKIEPHNAPKSGKYASLE